jgi:hypothetical protein
MLGGYNPYSVSKATAKTAVQLILNWEKQYFADLASAQKITFE